MFSSAEIIDGTTPPAPNMKISLLLKKLQSGDGVNKAELRSFEVLDEFDQLHPDFVARFGGGQSKMVATTLFLEYCAALILLTLTTTTFMVYVESTSDG